MAALAGTEIVLVVNSVGLIAICYSVALLLYAGATGVFWYVSWRHWPARVFAVGAELPGFRRQLQVLAGTMLVLVAGAFLITSVISVWHFVTYLSFGDTSDPSIW